MDGDADHRETGTTPSAGNGQIRRTATGIARAAVRTTVHPGWPDGTEQRDQNGVHDSYEAVAAISCRRVNADSVTHANLTEPATTRHRTQVRRPAVRCAAAPIRESVGSMLETTCLAIGALALNAIITPPTAGLAWGDCPGGPGTVGIECATLQVPVSWDDPGGRKITLMLGRLRSTAAEPQGR